MERHTQLGAHADRGVGAGVRDAGVILHVVHAGGAPTPVTRHQVGGEVFQEPATSRGRDRAVRPVALDSEEHAGRVDLAIAAATGTHIAAEPLGYRRHDVTRVGEVAQGFVELDVKGLATL